MSIRLKVILILLVILATLIGVLQFISGGVVLRIVLSLEDTIARTSLERTDQAVQDYLDVLDSKVNDWAPWDDTYSFIQGLNPGYVDENLDEATISNLDLNVLLFYDEDGKLYFEKTVDLETQQEIHFPADLEQWLQTNATIFRFTGIEDSLSGVIPLGERFLLVAARPILTNAAEGPIQGALVFGRFMDEKVFRVFSQDSLELSAYSLITTQLPADVKEALISLTVENPVHIKTLDADRIGGYILMEGLQGKPAAILRTELPRTIFQQWDDLRRFFLLFEIGISVGVVVLTGLLLDGLVLKRLMSLGRQVQQVGSTQAVKDPIRIGGKDELSILAADINKTLQALNESRQALQEQEAQYRSLVETIDDLVWEADQDGVLRYVSPQVLPLLGFQAEEMVGKTPLNLMAEEDRARVLAEIERQPVNNEPFHLVTLRLLHRQGHPVMMEVSGTPILSEQGEVIGYRGVGRDITGHWQAENALRESENALRQERDLMQSILASSPDAITIIDLEGVIVDCNPATLAMFNQSSKDRILGDSIFESVAPEDQERARNGFASVLSTGVIRNVELLCRGRKGRIFPGEVSASTVRDQQGNPRFMVVVSKDITERKRAERVQAATYQISQAAISAESLDELYESIYRILNQLFPAKNLFIALYDPAADLLSFPFCRDEYDPPPAPKRPEKGLTEYVLRTGQPLLASPQVFTELHAQGLVDSVGTPSLDWVGVPLKTKDHTIGVLVTQSYDEDIRYGQEVVEILSFVSNQIAMAIERKIAEASRRESELRLRRITDNMLDLVSETDVEGRICYTSPSHAAVLGYYPETLIGTSILDLIHPDDRVVFAQSQEAGIAQGTDPRTEVRFRHADGRYLWLEVMSNIIHDPHRCCTGAVHGCRDISDRKRAEEALRESEERYRSLVEYQGEGIGILDRGYRFLFANPAGEEIFGVEQDCLVGHSMEEFIESSCLPVFHQQTSRRDKGIQTSYEITILRPDLARRDVLVTANPWYASAGHNLAGSSPAVGYQAENIPVENIPPGDFIGWFVIFRDISERKQVEERLEYLSMHDVLTGLYNRAYFEEQITHLEHEKAYPVSVVMGDMDRLKATNDSLGHAAGDELLRQTANLLRSAFREGDVVARLGGDEFAVILPGADQETAEGALQRLRRKLAEYNKTAEVLKVNLSLGAATACEGMRLADAMDLADKRMYADKSSSRR